MDNWDWDKLQEQRKKQGRQLPAENQASGKKAENGDDQPFASKSGGGFSWKIPEKGLPSFGKMKWIVPIGIAVWLLSGIYIVNPDEQGVVLRFGKYVRTVDSGPHYAFPYPIEMVYKPKVTQVQRTEVGFRSVGHQERQFRQGVNRAMPEEAAMLTGDENIVNVQFSVQYQIKDSVEYLFNVTDQAAVVKNAAEAAMREVIGNSEIDSALTDGKLRIQTEATELLQSILDRYKVGVRVIAVQLQDVHPPKEVSDAFKDVASAREDKSRIVNEAEAYSNELIPKARGAAAALINEAQAYKETRIRNAEGESTRFLALLKEYNAAGDIMKKRLYFETMETLLGNENMEKIILPNSAAGSVLPLLPLLKESKKPAANGEKKS
ncbi:MAG: FtsH protease activity modulator HflK [Desulfovibrionaceae bacterium]|nr:FtsH protease activity modulator HflK [Desulfovibrionaceae bacterium]